MARSIPRRGPTKEWHVKTPARLSLALGSGLLLALTTLTPVAAATAAPGAAPTAAPDRFAEIPARAVIERAVTPSECGPTMLDDYITGLLVGMTPAQLGFTFDHLDALLGVPTFDPLFFGGAGDPDYALTLHEHQLRNTFRDVKRFWSDVQSDDIQLLAMHGDVLLDADRIERTLLLMQQHGLLTPPLDTATPEELRAEAETVAAFMRAQADVQFHDNPLWTLNAYAFTGEGDPDPFIAGLPDKLVFGDGFLVAYDELGLGDVGPRVVMGHEFAHHIQFELGVFDTGPADPVEATRRTELMADAMASYYGVHKKGLALNKKRVVDALLSFYTVGDCAFEDPGHHGTPLQRERAAAWGAALASAAKPRSFVLPASSVVEMFDAALPDLVAP
jgi:hypothetical protein